MKILITILILGLLLACSKKSDPAPTPKVVSDTLALKQGIYIGGGQHDTCLIVFVKDSVKITFKQATELGVNSIGVIYGFNFRNVELLKSSINQKAGNYGLFNGILVTSDSLRIGFQTNLDSSISIGCGNYNIRPIGDYSFLLDRGSTYKPGFKLNPSSIAGINGNH